MLNIVKCHSSRLTQRCDTRDPPDYLLAVLLFCDLLNFLLLMDTDAGLQAGKVSLIASVLEFQKEDQPLSFVT